jgi:hypothetical protein
MDGSKIKLLSFLLNIGMTEAFDWESLSNIYDQLLSYYEVDHKRTP